MTTTVQVAPNHLGTGCETRLSLLRKGLITINQVHNHDPLSEVVLLRSPQAQTFRFDAITPAFEEELVNICILARGADRSISAAVAKSFIRQRCSVQGIPFVPNIWSSRIYARALARLEGASENRNDATAFIERLAQTHAEDAEFFYGTDATGARTLRAAAWIPSSASAYMARRQLRIKQYAAYDDTFGAQGGYNLAALVSTDENGSMLVLAYFVIESNFADVHCFVARFIREKLRAAAWLRYIFSDEHKSIALAVREELPFAHHLLCMLHKMWNIAKRPTKAHATSSTESAGTAQATQEADSAGAAQGTPEAAASFSEDEADDGEGNVTPGDQAQPRAGRKPPRFPKAMAIAFAAATEADVELALDAAVAVYPEHAEYINNTIRPNVVKLAAAYRAFLALDQRSTSQLAESFFAAAKRGAIDPTKAFSTLIDSLDQLAAKLLMNGNLEKSSCAERRFKNMDKESKITNKWGKNFVASLEYIAPGARCGLLDNLSAAPDEHVYDLKFDELASEVGQLLPSSDLGAVVRGVVEYQSHQAGYTARDAAFLRWAALDSDSKRFFSARANASTRPHVVGVGSGGELVCTCGGLLETMVPCKHMLAGCREGKLAINLLVHSAPCVRTVESFELQGLDSFTMVVLQRTRNSTDTTGPTVDLELPFNAVVETLDVVDSAWRSKAAAWRFPVGATESDMTGGDDGVLNSDVEPSDVTEQLTRRRRHEQIELDVEHIIMALRALPLEGTDREALVKVKEEIVRIADRARAASLVRQGVVPATVATGTGSKRKVKRKQGMGDKLKQTRRKTSSLPSAKPPASKRAKV